LFAASIALWLLSGCLVSAADFNAPLRVAVELDDERHPLPAMVQPIHRADGPIVFGHWPAPAGEALRQEPPAPERLELRDRSLSISLMPPRGALRRRWPHWLVHDHSAGIRFAEPSLQILFCTWLA
jgi:hypothetical protein